MDNENNFKIADKILEKHYWSEIACINEFSTQDSEYSEKSLENEVKEYRYKIRLLVNQ